jgi:predicted RNase H-like HicB family nuclease
MPTSKELAENEKKPDRYVFPAVFTYDQDEAILMAQDALRGHLSCMEDDTDPIPAPGLPVSES